MKKWRASPSLLKEREPSTRTWIINGTQFICVFVMLITTKAQRSPSWRASCGFRGKTFSRPATIITTSQCWTAKSPRCPPAQRTQLMKYKGRCVTARVTHRPLYFINCVRWAGGHRGDFAVQHRDVVMMVAGRENVFPRNPQEARQLGERCAFVVISMTKTQINCVPLVIQVRMLGSRSFNKLGDARHFFIVLCHKPLETLGVVNKTRFRVSVHEIHDFGKDRVSR